MMDLRKIFATLVLAGSSYLLMAASAYAQQTQFCDSEQSFGRADKTLFGRYCATCHSISGKWKRIFSPPLGGLFERGQSVIPGQNSLVTGEPITEQTVRAFIEKGGPSLMPGFQYTLTSDQINELIQFLKVARCPDQASAPGEGL